MRWFGDPWEGEVCEVFLRITNPGGECFFCKQPIVLSDQGFSFEGGAACHRKCLSRGINGKTWVDHVWVSERVSLWNLVWTCTRCGVSVGIDPTTQAGLEQNLRCNGLRLDCHAQVVEDISKL